MAGAEETAGGVRAREPLTHRPSAELLPYVRSMAGYELDGIDVVHHGLPSTDLTFILALGTPLRVGWNSDRARAVDFQALVSGLHTAPAFVFPTPQHAGIQLGVTPVGVRALFGRPAAELHAELIDLQELWSSMAVLLIDRLAECVGWSERFRVLDLALLDLLQPDRGEIRTELNWAWRQLVGGATHTVQLADEIGWSRGYFARLFAAEYGLKPKETARIVRFGNAKQALLQPGAVLSDIAFATGYADQAHLTREWRRLAGCTPTEWQTEMFAFVQDDGGSTPED